MLLLEREQSNLTQQGRLNSVFVQYIFSCFHIIPFVLIIVHHTQSTTIAWSTNFIKSLGLKQERSVFINSLNNLFKNKSRSYFFVSAAIVPSSVQAPHTILYSQNSSTFRQICNHFVNLGSQMLCGNVALYFYSLASVPNNLDIN